MGRIVVTENVSLDGVIQDPTGEEGSERGGWFSRMGDEDRQAWAKTELDEVSGAEALLLGRRTYEFFAARWPARRGPFADRLNGMPKYVVSSTLAKPAWNNSTVLHGKAVNEVRALKQRVRGDMVVYASFQLVHTLIDHGLVDELRLIIFPSVVGTGERLFGTTRALQSLRRVDVRTIGQGLARLVYELAGESYR